MELERQAEQPWGHLIWEEWDKSEIPTGCFIIGIPSPILHIAACGQVCDGFIHFASFTAPLGWDNGNQRDYASARKRQKIYIHSNCCLWKKKREQKFGYHTLRWFISQNSCILLLNNREWNYKALHEACSPARWTVPANSGLFYVLQPLCSRRAHKEYTMTRCCAGTTQCISTKFSSCPLLRKCNMNMNVGTLFRRKALPPSTR